MYEVIKSAVIDFGIYGLFVLIYTLVGAYQNINIWGNKFDWKRYANGLVKYLALGAALVATTFGAYILLDQATKQGIELVNAQALAPRVILGVVILASAGMLVKIVTKLGTTLGLTDEQLKALQTKSVNTPDDKPLVLNVDGIPMPSDDYIAKKKADEADPENTGLGSIYSVPIGSYDAFRGSVLGRGFDIDNYYGFQCWDGAALLWQQLGMSLFTGNGLAIGCWDLKRDANKGDQFDLVGDVNSLQRGDVVVMRPNHIGFFDGYDGNYMVILGQNQGGSPANAAGGSGFNIARVAKSAFAGAFRYHAWATAPAPTPAPAPAPAPASGDTSGFNVGDTVTVNNPVDVHGTHLATSGNYTVMEVNNGSVVIGRGGAVTARVLASNLSKVGGAPAPEPSAPIAVGDTVVPTNLIDYNGTHLTQYDDTYTVTQLVGDRAVLSARGAVWAAMHLSDIRKA